MAQRPPRQDSSTVSPPSMPSSSAENSSTEADGHEQHTVPQEQVLAPFEPLNIASKREPGPAASSATPVSITPRPRTSSASHSATPLGAGQADAVAPARDTDDAVAQRARAQREAHLRASHQHAGIEDEPAQSQLSSRRSGENDITAQELRAEMESLMSLRRRSLSQSSSDPDLPETVAPFAHLGPAASPELSTSSPPLSDEPEESSFAHRRAQRPPSLTISTDPRHLSPGSAAASPTRGEGSSPASSPGSNVGLPISPTAPAPAETGTLVRRKSSVASTSSGRLPSEHPLPPRSPSTSMPSPAIAQPGTSAALSPPPAFTDDGSIDLEDRPLTSLAPGGGAPSSDLFWLPASLHPELAPRQFKAFIREQARGATSPSPPSPVNESSAAASVDPELSGPAPDALADRLAANAPRFTRQGGARPVERRKSTLRGEYRPRRGDGIGEEEDDDVDEDDEDASISGSAESADQGAAQRRRRGKRRASSTTAQPPLPTRVGMRRTSSESVRRTSADAYGADGRLRFQDLTIADLQRLEELAARAEAESSGDAENEGEALGRVLRRSLSLNPTQVAAAAASARPMHSSASMGAVGAEAPTSASPDSPIIMHPPGQVLRRSAHTKIRKQGLAGDGGGHRFASTRRRRASGEGLAAAGASIERPPSARRASSEQVFIDDDRSAESDDTVESPQHVESPQQIESPPPTGEPAVSEPELEPAPEVKEPEPAPPQVGGPAPSSADYDWSTHQQQLREHESQRLQHPVPIHPYNQRAGRQAPPPAPVDLPTSGVPSKPVEPSQPPQPVPPKAQPALPARPTSAGGREKKSGWARLGLGRKETSTDDGVKKEEAPKEKESTGFFTSLFGAGKRKAEAESAASPPDLSSREASPDILRQLPPPPPTASGMMLPSGKYVNFYRLPIHVERAVYRLSHIKLANPRRPLYEQVLISNLMFWYLSVINKPVQQAPAPPPPPQQPEVSAQMPQADEPLPAVGDVVAEERLPAGAAPLRGAPAPKERRPGLSKPDGRRSPTRSAETPVRPAQYEQQNRLIDREVHEQNVMRPLQASPPPQASEAPVKPRHLGPPPRRASLPTASENAAPVPLYGAGATASEAWPAHANRRRSSQSDISVASSFDASDLIEAYQGSPEMRRKSDLFEADPSSSGLNRDLAGEVAEVQSSSPAPQ